MMHPPRVFVLNGLSSYSAKSLFLLLLFAGSLSIIVSPASGQVAGIADSKTDNATTAIPASATVPVEFPQKGALLCATATTIPAKNGTENGTNPDSEAIDMMHTICSLSDAAVDTENSDEVQAANDKPTTVKSTEASTATASPSTSATPNLIGSTNSSAGDQVTQNVTVEETPTASTSTTISTPSSTSATTTEITPTTTEPSMTQTNSTISSVITTSQSIPEESSARATKYIDNSGGGMPSGIIALVTMITFVIIAVVAYIGLIAWRRYLEYRYGNRELLVNDLEFDTNDLRHFEL